MHVATRRTGDGAVPPNPTRTISASGNSPMAVVIGKVWLDVVVVGRLLSVGETSGWLLIYKV